MREDEWKRRGGFLRGLPDGRKIAGFSSSAESRGRMASLVPINVYAASDNISSSRAERSRA